MTNVQISLPDELARDANAAGLLTSDALQDMLREGLRAKARRGLETLWAGLDDAGLMPDIEAEIEAEVCKVRSRRSA